MPRYSNAKRKEIHDQLVVAKKYLWDGKEEKPEYSVLGGKQQTITSAISNAQGLYYSAGGDELIACKMIKQRIGTDRLLGLENWLGRVAKIPRPELTHLAMQTYRHSWLDHLIAEFAK